MTSPQLLLGGGQLDRRIDDAALLLSRYRQDTGCDYLDYRSTATPPDKLLPEDLAVTLLLNSRVGWLAFRSIRDRGQTVDLGRLPQKPLQETTQDERQQVAAFVAEVAQWPGFAASVATKVLHKKRPDLIPILDNEAIFGAYMNPAWPQKTARTESVKDLRLIRRALDWVAFDITRPDNEPAWRALLAIEPTRTRIQLFDSVWWMHFRLIQPVHASS